MKDLIKIVALEVANTPRFNDIGEATLTGFATVFLAELSKRAEASCVEFQHEDTGRTTSVAIEEAETFELLNPRWFKIGPLFTFPPIHDIRSEETLSAFKGEK